MYAPSKNKIPLAIFVPLILLLFGGCLSSETPFFQETDIVEDPRIMGSFESEAFPIRVSIAKAKGDSRSYLLHISEGSPEEGEGFAEYIGTLFKSGNSTYFDLFPVQEKHLLKKYHDGKPTASLALSIATHSQPNGSGKKLHALFKVSISEDEVICWVPKSNNERSNVISKMTELKPITHGDGFVIDSSKFHLILSTAKSSSLFDEINQYVFTKSN